MNEKYIEYLKYELNYSDNTIDDYSYHISNYLKYLEEKKVSYLNITKDDIYNYLKYLDSKKLSNKSIGNILSSIRSYYNYLLNEGIIDKNLFSLISNPKLDRKLPNFLTYEDMEMIFESLPNETILDKRNRVIVEVLYSSGIRLSELINIKKSDINFSDRSIRILGKGNKERIVLFGVHAHNAIDNYFAVREDNSEYLIVNNKGNKISSRGVEKIISTICDNAMIKTKASPHTFRHTFATHLLNNGADIKSVGELLGHSSLNTTEIYTHITSDYLKEVYHNTMPRK